MKFIFFFILRLRQESAMKLYDIDLLSFKSYNFVAISCSLEY